MLKIASRQCVLCAIALIMLSVCVSGAQDPRETEFARAKGRPFHELKAAVTRKHKSVPPPPPVCAGCGSKTGHKFVNGKLHQLCPVFLKLQKKSCRNTQRREPELVEEFKEEEHENIPPSPKASQDLGRPALAKKVKKRTFVQKITRFFKGIGRVFSNKSFYPNETEDWLDASCARTLKRLKDMPGKPYLCVGSERYGIVKRCGRTYSAMDNYNKRGQCTKCQGGLIFMVGMTDNMIKVALSKPRHACKQCGSGEAPKPGSKLFCKDIPCDKCETKSAFIDLVRPVREIRQALLRYGYVEIDGRWVLRTTQTEIAQNTKPIDL